MQLGLESFHLISLFVTNTSFNRIDQPLSKQIDQQFSKQTCNLQPIKCVKSKLELYMDVTFAIQIGSDWPQIGQIWDFLMEPKFT